MASALQLLALLVAGLVLVSLLAATGGSGGFLVVLMAAAGVALALYEHDAGKHSDDLDATEREDDPHPSERDDDTGVCSACGELVPAGKRRCEDCSVVGTWRK